MRILHITPHTGGGIGKAISGLIQENNSNIHHDVLFLEKPIETKYLNSLDHNQILFAANLDDYDIIQVEFFNNPLIPKFLCSQKFNGRFIFWCHISGLHTPIIPLFNRTTTFPLFEIVLTSPCSLNKYPNCPVICSAGIPKDFPMISSLKDRNGHYDLCYLGTLDRTKMHPEYMSIISPIKNYDKIELFVLGGGNDTEYYKDAVEKLSLTNSVHILGHCKNPESTMLHMDFMVYLLNPFHYGTAENALVEAMAIGVVPIVLGNPAEMCIVKDKTTGLVMRDASPESFTDILDWIIAKPTEVAKIRERCIRVSRLLYNYRETADQFEYLYSKVMKEPKKTFDFTQIFGNEPHNWFKSFQEYPDSYHEEDTGSVYNLPYSVSRSGNPCKDAVIFAEGKGSVKNYARYFPEDKLLREWSSRV